MLRKNRLILSFVMILTLLVGISASHFYRAARHTHTNQDLREAGAQPTAGSNWTEQLESIRLQTMLTASGIRRRNLATLALADYERILPHLQSPDLRIGVLTAAAYCAFEAGDLDKADRYAEKAIQEETLPKPTTLQEVHSVYIDSNNPFYCHLLLGRIALRKGDRNKAKHQLLAAGAVTVPRQGFCWLSPFGQTSPLAQELLEKGERKTVLEYFQRCNKSGHDSVLIQWSKDVRAGKTPDFCPYPDARHRVIAIEKIGLLFQQSPQEGSMFSLIPLMLVGMSLGQTPQPVQPFPDVPKTHWAYAAVTELHEKGILKGYPSAYDRSTPHAALFSLIKAINNDDKAMIQELTTSKELEYWMVRMEVFSSDSHQRTAALKQATVLWKQWARFPRDAGDVYEDLTWEEFNAKANRLPLGTETFFHRWVDKFDVDFEFVQDPSGWKVTHISGRH